MASEKIITCPIWRTYAIEKPFAGDGKIIDSPRAGGSYFISGTALALLKMNNEYYNEYFKKRLTDYIIDQHLLGEELPKINSNLIEKEINHREDRNIFERIDLLVEYSYKNSNLIGTVIRFSNDEPFLHNKSDIKVNTVKYSLNLLAWTSSLKMSEVMTIAEFCHELKYIELRKYEDFTSSMINTKNRSFAEFMLKPAGFAKIYEKRQGRTDSAQAFVAMWFDESMNDIYNQAIAPAIKEAGYKPLRIDRKQHNNKIDDEIIAEIRRSRFLVSDFTYGKKGMRGGVYYEAGFAHGLGIPVIFTCKNDDGVELHFDTRQYNHILWREKEIEKFKKELSDRISATIGDGPLKS